MDAKILKEHLFNNPECIEKVLEDIGCSNIKNIRNERIQCALPDGDNPTSVQIILKDFLPSHINTRSSEFEKYEIKDIYSVVQFITNRKLKQVISLICKTCGINNDYYNNNFKKSNSYNFIKQFKKTNQDIHNEDDVLPESYVSRFVREDCWQYTKDGINSEAQEKFGISYDILDNRVVFPIRNEIGQLISFKGRTCDSGYKVNNIPKFIHYYPCSSNNYLFGMYENAEFINQSEEVYACEAEKGVMQLYSMGIRNAISINKKKTTYHQVKKLIQLKKRVVLLLDKDVSLEDIYIECRKFKGLSDVYYIYDNLGLLDEKDSPMDKGYDVFCRLINECKFKYKGE